ncbi:amino acid ABC transporter permease [Vallicoccus soli]|uniref:Amino acid ABC transporter permease n=1 Tax=Vallicoccus soli TaxID=2339232 RepID=A0A3A3Z1J9_9ACTN|nr:amino acid ABC transporter permease [Vallicoccus soli]RJK96472.1 amino acid ABC transporter permease [Vallicoccus soli]
MNVVLDNLDVFVDGFRTTVSLTLLSALGALVLGTIVAAMRVGPVPPLRWAGAAYVQVVRNTPLTLVFFFCVFGLPEVDVILSFYQFAVVALSVYTGAFVAEALRSGINSVPVGQAEASRSLGMTFSQTLGLVVLPQAVRAVIPPLSSIFIALLKNTSIAYAFGVFEAMQASYRLVNDFGSAVLWILATTAVIYLVLALVSSAVFSWVERRVAIAR